MDFIFKKYDEKTSTILAKNVFVTGAAAKLPGLKERLESDLISLRPFKSETNVDIASNPSIDAYRGMQKFSRSFFDDNTKWITKAEYEEKGSGLLKNHFCSNLN